jgi:hypothetical protein
MTNEPKFKFIHSEPSLICMVLTPSNQYLTFIPPISSDLVNRLCLAIKDYENEVKQKEIKIMTDAAIKQEDHSYYLGDGVYASFDGYHIILKVNSHDQPTDTIYLEPEIIRRLIDYSKLILGDKI